MRPIETTSQPGAQVSALAGHIATWLIATGVHVLVGLAAGRLLARWLRGRGLHWSWPAPLAAVILFTTAPPAITLAIACVSASIRGRRWHREDLDAGADLARIAALRRTPIDALRPALRAALRRLPTLRVDAASRGELVVGVDERDRPVAIPFGDERSGRHTLVVGATGSGKTVTQVRIAASAVERGMGAVVLDPKGDRHLSAELQRAAAAAGRTFVQWTPDGGSVYNPYARGSETEIADKVLAGERFTEPHYLRQAQRYLGHVVRALRGCGRVVSLAAIVEQLDPIQLELLARELPQAHGEAIHAYLDSLSARQQSELSGVRDRLAILAESDVGAWLDPRTPSVERLELLQATRERAVVCFSLESDSRPLLSEMLGAAIVQDLQTVVAALQGRPIPTIVVIDEFSAVAATQVVRLFNRARSAGFNLVLGTQELSDLRPPGRTRLLEQVMGNLTALIAHRQVVPDSARLIATVGGSAGTWRVSRHSDGRTTRTRTREATLCPDDVMGLDSGQAAVIVPGRGVRMARIHMASIAALSPGERRLPRRHDRPFSTHS